MVLFLWGLHRLLSCSQVALSGGRSFFRPTSVADEEYENVTGEREDGQDYVQQWLSKGNSAGERREYVWNKTAFDYVDPVTTDKLLGVLSYSQ